ncbi:MAG TPA: YbhB/YbcL family Raf kinase inhibitor-like protein [Chthoniobacterales bacterium]|nr:YbhB/YbcL family Raf kinase inhibitor-like protein [Chthoniobacterales bacterium]
MKPTSFALAIFIGTILDMNAAPSISVTTPAFQAGGDIPAKFTCNGANINPELKINGTPNEAKSLVLIVDDPDAPHGLFTHWILWNIDPKTTNIGENSAPVGGIQGTNDFGKRNYGGPCPPSGTHRYFFKIFALDTKLDLKPSARRAELDAAMRGHTLAQGELMGRYSHK